jgi:hypothetical protein
MDRGLKAPLNPHEEVALRRVRLGIANGGDLPARNVERLKGLLLIEEPDAALRLTPIEGKATMPFQTLRLSPPWRPTRLAASCVWS